MTWCTWYLNYRSQMPQHKNKWQFHLANQSDIVEKHFRGHFWQSIRKYSFIYFNFRFLNLNNLCNLWRELMQVKLKILTNLVIVPLHERVNLNVSSGVKQIQQVKKRLIVGNIQHIFWLLANFTSFDSKGTDYYI